MTGVWIRSALLLGVVGVSLYCVPLVRVVRLGAGGDAAGAAFDPDSFAHAFWEDQLVPALPDAAEAEEVMDALEQDAEATGDRYGRRSGVSRGYYLFVRGEGVAGETSASGVTLTLPSGARVTLQSGPLFGSAIRDATGLLDPSVAPSSREYNALAQSLNAIAEERAAAEVPAIEAGSKVRFVGCAKVAKPARYAPPLVVCPIQVEVL